MYILVKNHFNFIDIKELKFIIIFFCDFVVIKKEYDVQNLKEESCHTLIC